MGVTHTYIHTYIYIYIYIYMYVCMYCRWPRGRGASLVPQFLTPAVKRASNTDIGKFCPLDVQTAPYELYAAESTGNPTKTLSNL